jgi:hypothetical protein
MKYEIVMRGTFEGWHHWPKAPKWCGYLKNIHRHIFHVTAWKKVTHTDREVEFNQYKREMMTEFVNKHRLDKNTWHWSCEDWGRWAVLKFKLRACEVSEDGENGALVTADTIHLA